MRRLFSSPRTLPAATAVFAALLLALLAAVFYSPILLGIRTFPDGDFTHHFLPFSLFQQQELLSGRLPVWNPYTYGGHPFLADVQAAVFYPISNLVLGLTLPFTDAGVRLYFLEVEAIVQIVLAGFFTYLLVRDLTGSRQAALLAGALFAFSGYLTGYPPLQLAVLRTAIWLPLILWLLLRMAWAPHRWRWGIGAGGGLAVSFLAGHSQTFLYIVYVTGAWMAVLLGAASGAKRKPVNPSTSSTSSTSSTHQTALLLGKFVLVVVLAVGLSAAQWLPSVEFVAESVRANVDYAFVSGGFPLQDTWQLLMPGVLTQFSPLYIGVVGLGLVVLALGAWPVAASVLAGAPAILKARWGILFFAGMALVALLLAYGGNGFLYPVFYRFAPGWSLFRGQERAAYLVALGLCVLAGYGAAAIPGMALRRRARLATIYIVLVAAGVYVLG
ncbi:MAG: hypothetical protein IPK16_09410 [Anaerolineales bacterium]|nr:hypothetical protein [Anaerolineales bacterium]